MTSTAKYKKQLVLIGGGHAHMVTLAKLDSFIAKGYGVTVIQPSDYHYYSGMGPGMLGDYYAPKEVRFATRRQVEQRGGTFIRDRVTRINPHKRQVFLKEADSALHYDVLSCNVGSQVISQVAEADNEKVFAVKPIEKLLAARDSILTFNAERPMQVAVIGGGPSAVEVAGNVWRLGSHNDGLQIQIQIITSSTIMPRLTRRIQKLARESLQRRQIEIIENEYVESVQGGTITLRSGISYEADIIFTAVGVKPPALFSQSGLATGPDGGLAVNSYLQHVEHKEIFGGGDCIYHQPKPLDKVGVYAVRQNPVLYHNLMATLDGEPLRRFDPGGKYLLVYNLGDDTGIFSKWSISLDGRLAFRIKDIIDRKFMQAFQ